MAKKKTRSPSLPEGLLEAVGGFAYLAGRPSFARVAAKAKANGWPKPLTREQYVLLYQPIRTRAQLERVTETDTDELKLIGQDINAWSQTPGGSVQVKLHYKTKADEPPVVQPPRRMFRISEKAAAGTRMQALVIPDIHFGWYEEGGETFPIHDEAIVAVYVEIARRFQPKLIVQLGDLLDLAPFSTFVGDPGYRGFTQAALSSAYDFIGELREASPGSRVVVLEGNHEARIMKSLQREAPELVRLSRAGEAEAVLSVEYLLRLRELQVEYVGPYGTHFWCDGVRYMHNGRRYGSKGGQTVAKLLEDYPDENTFSGHTHRAEFAVRTRRRREGRSTHWAAVAGTGARIDESVPGADDPDWQNSAGAVWWPCQPALYLIESGMVSIDGVMLGAQPVEDGDEAA
jgi:hypothetical protein